METDEDSSGALGAGEHGGGSHQLQSPGSNPLGVGQGGNAAEGYVAKYAAKGDRRPRWLLGPINTNFPRRFLCCLLPLPNQCTHKP